VDVKIQRQTQLPSLVKCLIVWLTGNYPLLVIADVITQPNSVSGSYLSFSATTNQKRELAKLRNSLRLLRSCGATIIILLCAPLWPVSITQVTQVIQRWIFSSTSLLCCTRPCNPGICCFSPWGRIGPTVWHCGTQRVLASLPCQFCSHCMFYLTDFP
jgi:hypothetical protein